MLEMLEELVQASMAYALAHRSEAMDFARDFGRGPLSAVRDDFVAKFANEDTLLMPSDVRLGLSVLYTKAYKRGFTEHYPALDIIDPPTRGESTRGVAA
jgi:predicted solute-binding protein